MMTYDEYFMIQYYNTMLVYLKLINLVYNEKKN